MHAGTSRSIANIKSQYNIEAPPPVFAFIIEKFSFKSKRSVEK